MTPGEEEMEMKRRAASSFANKHRRNVSCRLREDAKLFVGSRL